MRARTQKAVGYGDVLILWPDAEDFPIGGEVDFMEIPKPERNEYTFNLHYGADNSQNGTKVAGDFTQWHNYAVEWMPDHVAGFVDGQEVFRTTEREQIPPRPMHLAMQQDIGPYDNWIPPRDAPPRPRSTSRSTGCASTTRRLPPCATSLRCPPPSRGCVRSSGSARCCGSPRRPSRW